MSFLVTSPDDAESVMQEQIVVPPLFAGPLRDDLAACISSALAAGDHEKAAVLLHEADCAFPDETAFTPLHSQCLQLAQRKAQFEAALQEALNELGEDCFAGSLGKFREALSLSREYELFARKIYDAGVDAAQKQVHSHWRFAEALLHELTAVSSQPAPSSALWTAIESRRREETVRVALEESACAEHTAYLPHLRDRLAELAMTYPEAEHLVESRIGVLDGLLVQRSAEEREKNLRRLMLFRDRLDFTSKPETLLGFTDLVAPFVDPYRTDPAFLAVLAEIHQLRSTYESAALLVDENRLQDVLLICDQVLRKRPANVLFCALEEKVKSREWLARRVTSATQRARTFEQRAQYAQALEEWELLREIDPRYPGLDSEILHCAALRQQSEDVRLPQSAPSSEVALTPEIVRAEAETEYDSPPTALVTRPHSAPLHAGLRIAITEEAWGHLKTGLVAAFALLLIVLVLASSTRH
jgi:hypothetical protein